MKSKLPLLLLSFFLLDAPHLGHAAVPQQKDYLSAVEADKIRDAETVNERIKLFLMFAEDRLKKFQFELDHPSSNRHAEMLNALLNAYVGCVDDAADLIQLGIEKQENIRQGIDLMTARAKATRCCWPPESWCGYLSASSSRPICCSTARTRVRTSAAGTCRSRSP